jgi:F-box interacting protein
MGNGNVLDLICPPNAPFVKKSSVCGHGGLMCAEVAKGELVVFNPLTMHTMALPPLLHPRSSVLVHILVDPATKAYKVIVAGSSTQSDKHLSKKMEVFDSQTSKWEEAPDLPGPAFGLNEYQTGVCVNGILYLIIFLKGHKPCNRGVVAFDVKDGKWLENMACPIPFSSYWNTLQLVETNGKVYLFSEQDVAVPSSKCCNHVCVSMHLMDHCIDVLEISGRGVACHWRNVVRVTKLGGRQFQVYPEPMCVPFGKDKLCIFNPLTCDGVVYDMQNGGQCDVLRPPPPDCKGDSFFSLNPASFTLQLSPECQSNQ